ncbi:MAG TPA: GNAT family N-acetyltransferase [Candidatus Binatia bacterium]|nr:GNAT family N-acetyltransferase [Candidatus Binatia bacterium]
MPPDEYRIRAAGKMDAEVIARQRVGMLRDMGMLDRREIDSLLAASRAYFAAALPSGEYRGWVVERGGEVAAGGGLLLRRLLPRPGHAEVGEEAYVLNVYTEPPHRRRGIARRLTEYILAWCRARGVSRVALHASVDGRHLYEQLGFVPTNEMRLELSP